MKNIKINMPVRDEVEGFCRKYVDGRADYCVFLGNKSCEVQNIRKIDMWCEWKRCRLVSSRIYRFDRLIE